MKRFRTVLFWTHLVVGAAAGIVILIMSVTGVALTYEKQVLEWVDRRAWATAAAGGSLLPPELLLATAARESGLAATGITIRARADAPATVTLHGNKSLLLDPYSGAVIGEAPTAIRSFFRTMTLWHRYIALEGASRATGKWITGAANLGFLFLVLSGLFLWIPRAWAWVQFRNIVWFRAGLSSKARDFNWHNVVGFWSAIPLAIVIAGAVPISFSWASSLVYRITGDTPPSAAQSRPAETKPQLYVASGLDASWAAAMVEAPGWRTISSRLAASDQAPIVITVDDGYPGQPQKRRTLTFDRESGAIVKNETFGDLSAGRRARSWLRFAHTGEFYGLIGQTLAGLVSAGGAFLVYTGLALAVRRLMALIKPSRQRGAHDQRRAA